MAYFLKKSKLKKGLYLQIYESFYNPQKKGTSHKSYKSLGYVDELAASGIDDPVSHFSAVVDRMNLEANRTKEQKKARLISDSPERYLGYFPLKALYDGLHVSNYLDLLQTTKGFRFRLSDLLEALIYSRMLEPCSKRRTLGEVVPRLYSQYRFSYDQLLEGVEYMGSEYERIIEVFNHQVRQKYPFDTTTTYFDCTNFYFEIDREDAFRKKGPSKENRRDPIVGLGLLLDAGQVPVGMKLYPGNESEKPVIREAIHELKERGRISGRTIQVADKGLNCAENIIAALSHKDGYIFSKSVKTLPETEKTWVLLDNDYQDVFDGHGQLLYRMKECVDDFPYRYTGEDGRTRTVKLREKRIATYNPKLAEKKRYEIGRQVEKARRLKAGGAKRQEYGDCGKYVTFRSTDDRGNATQGRVMASINQEAVEKDLRLAGYNMIVTSELSMGAAEIYHTYHNLWRIEESFRLMKTYLDARPVYMQKTDSIKGHFLICYLSVLLFRLLQFKVLDERYGTEQLVRFIRDFRIAEVRHNEYVNLMTSNDLARSLAKELDLPITNYFLNDSQIKKMLGHRF